MKSEPVNAYKILNNLLSYLTIFILTLLLGCASLIPFPSAKPFSQEETARLISHLRKQGESIFSFQGVGKIRFKKGEEETEANLFAVGCRPFKVRLEIAHPWGRPLFHIVVDEKNISVLSLTDKKFFKGPSSPSNTNQFFLRGLDLDLTWKIFSGRVPILTAADRAVSLNPNEITLFNSQGEVVEIISFVSGSLQPKYVYFPKKGITIILAEFKKEGLGLYPLRIEIVKEDEDQLTEIRYKNFKFNKPVPEEIFLLNPPLGFEIINLSSQKD